MWLSKAGSLYFCMIFLVVNSSQVAYFLFASTEWTFHSGRNKMVHLIPAGMEQFIPAGKEWAITFWTQMNGQYYSGQYGKSHLIPARAN